MTRFLTTLHYFTNGVNMTQASGFLFSFSVCVYQLKRVDVFKRPVKGSRFCSEQPKQDFSYVRLRVYLREDISTNLRSENICSSRTRLDVYIG